MAAVRSRWWAWLDTRRLVLVVTLAAVFAMAARVPVDSDGWWHLAGGRYIVEEGAIPRADPFSHTRAGAPWIDNGWLAQVIFYLLYRLMGYAGLGLAVAVSATVALALVWPQMSGGPFVRAFILVLAATVSGPVWTVRPHLATYVLMAVLGWLLSLWRRGRRWALWCVPPLFVLWVNLHAGYTLGLALLALTVAGAILDRLRRGERAHLRHELTWWDVAWLASVGVLALLLVLVNPYGARMWRYPFYNAGQQVARQYIAEWASPDFHELVNQPFAVLLLVTLLALGLSGRPARWTELLPVVGFAYLTLQSQRTMGLFALAAVPVLSRAVASGRARRALANLWSPRRPLPLTRGRATLNAALALLIISAALLKAGVVWHAPSVEAAVQEVGFPVGAVDWMARHHPAGPLYNPYQWGGYLIWRLAPGYPVFADGRADLYGDEFLLEYLELAAARPGWEARLDAYGVRTALVTADGPLSRAMAASPAWEQGYEDGVAQIYVRGDESR